MRWFPWNYFDQITGCHSTQCRVVWGSGLRDIRTMMGSKNSLKQCRALLLSVIRQYQGVTTWVERSCLPWDWPWHGHRWAPLTGQHRMWDHGEVTVTPLSPDTNRSVSPGLLFSTTNSRSNYLHLIVLSDAILTVVYKSAIKLRFILIWLAI